MLWLPYLWSDGRRAKIVLRHRLQQQLRRGSRARSCHVAARITVARALDACPVPAHAALLMLLLPFVETQSSQA